MEANKVHLHEEFSSNRLTGKDYVQAYVAMTTTAMSAAVQYLLSKDNAYYQATLVQKQAQIASIEVVRAKVELEKTKAELRAVQMDVKTRAAQYAHTKMMIASEDAKRCLTQSQEAQVNYETGSIMPKQLEALTIGISKTTAEKDQVLYQTANILPEQLLNLTAEKNQKVYQTENVMPAQKENITVDTAGKTYTNTFILPEQLELARENVESTRAKTKDTRRDGAIINGSIGTQVALHRQQISSYKRDAEWKVAKGLIDTWITGKSLDEAYSASEPVTAFQGGQIDAFLTLVKNNLNT
jgi:hypothetical protein